MSWPKRARMDLQQRRTLTKGREIKEQLANLDHKLASIEKEFNILLRKVPNMPLEEVPVGAKPKMKM
jgi:seryl-tRNA synthetase